MTKQKEETKKENAAIFDDDEEISLGANFDYENPLHIEDPDPNMHYYFAAVDGDKGRPDGVARVMQRGYQKSSKKHYSTDCELMECPKELYEKRMRIERKRSEDLERATMEPTRGLHKVRDDHGIEKRKV